MRNLARLWFWVALLGLAVAGAWPAHPQAKARRAPNAGSQPAADAERAAETAPKEFLEAAQKALERKDYPQAVALLRNYLERKPDDYRALFNLAYAYSLLGNRSQAMETYNKTLAAQPQLFEAHLNLGILLLDDHRPAEAVPHLAAAVAAKPQDFRASLLYADALAAKAEHAAAIEQYGKALGLNRNSAEAHLGLGRVWAGEKRFARAEQEISRAIELSPKDNAIRLELARVYELEGRPEQAAQVYADYLKQEPGVVAVPQSGTSLQGGAGAVQRKLGAIYLAQKKYTEAAAAFEEAARLAPAAEDDWNLARTYAGAQQPDRALPHLERLKQASPGNFEVLLLLGQMLILKRDFAAAEQELQSAVRARPEVPDAYVELANAVYLEGRYPETIAVLDRLARLAPETPWSSFLRAISLDKLDQVQPALESYQRFLALDGGKHPDQDFQARQRIKVLNLRLQKGGKRRGK